MPGAGDDEETWSGGLTPAMFWSEHNHETLLAASAYLHSGPGARP